MIPNPDMVFYACIAREATILAEFNSKDAHLGALALQCLEKAPVFHHTFSHTVRGKTYMFFFDDPLLYFAIFDDKFENPDGLLFLKSVRDAFNTVVETNSVKKRLDTMNYHCFQGEFNPVFYQLLACPSDLEDSVSPRLALKNGHNRSGGLDSPGGKKLGSIPLLGNASKSLKKKKRLLFGGANGETKDEKKVDVSDDTIVLSRELSVGMQKSGGLFDSGQQRTKKVWKKHVWVVLCLDLIVCTILFVIWLCICRGFKCIDG